MILVIKAFFALSYFFTIALIGMFLCLFRPFHPDNSRLCARLFSLGGLKILGIKLVVEGREHLENMSPSVIVANHQDNLDLFIHGGVIPKRTVSIGKKSLKYLPLFGQMYWLSGNIMIDRNKSRESIDAMTETTEALKYKNTSIWVFAEGTRNKGENLLPFKKGAFHIARQASAPIIPICASSYPKHLRLNKLNAGTVILKILPPVETCDLSEEEFASLRSSIHQSMQKTIDRLDERVLKV